MKSRFLALLVFLFANSAAPAQESGGADTWWTFAYSLNYVWVQPTSKTYNSSTGALTSTRKSKSESVVHSWGGGYNFRLHGGYFAGIGTALGYNDASSITSSPGFFQKFSDQYSTNLRFRLGYEFDRFSIYGQTGLQWSWSQQTRQQGAATDKVDIWGKGWLVSAGIIVPFNERWGAFGEVRYGVSKSDTLFPNAGLRVVNEAPATSLQLALRYRFGL